MTTITQAPHISFDRQNRPWIAGANTKVIEVALSHIAYGWSAEVLHENYPHLSLAEIYAALAYYYDNKEEMDRAIEEQYERVEQMRRAAGKSPLARKLRATGQIP
jgi:uncharacterized protein (DUF433 family)